MAGLDARFKPGVNVPAFAKTAVVGGRFVKIVDDKHADGDYQVGHCGLGQKPFGVAVADSGPTTQSEHSVERRINVVRSGAIARVEPGAAITAGDEVQSDATGKAVPLDAEVAAHLDTGVIGDNNALRWTAKDPGADGNTITLAIINAGDANTTLNVVVDDGDIVVNLGTTNAGPGAITSTAQDVIDLIEADTDANALVAVDNRSTSTGLGLMAALAETNLAGGLNSSPPGAGIAAGQAVMTAADDDDFVEVALY